MENISKHFEPVKQKLNLEPNTAPKNSRRLTIKGYSVEDLSISGHQTCIIFPLNLFFDSSSCLHCTISQYFLFISHVIRTKGGRELSEGWSCFVVAKTKMKKKRDRGGREKETRVFWIEKVDFEKIWSLIPHFMWVPHIFSSQVLINIWITWNECNSRSSHSNSAYLNTWRVCESLNHGTWGEVWCPLGIWFHLGRMIYLRGEIFLCTPNTNLVHHVL